MTDKNAKLAKLHTTDEGLSALDAAKLLEDSMSDADRDRKDFRCFLNREGGEPSSPGGETDDYTDNLLSQRGTVDKDVDLED